MSYRVLRDVISQAVMSRFAIRFTCYDVTRCVVRCRCRKRLVKWLQSHPVQIILCVLVLLDAGIVIAQIMLDLNYYRGTLDLNHYRGAHRRCLTATPPCPCTRVCPPTSWRFASNVELRSDRFPWVIATQAPNIKIRAQKVSNKTDMKYD